jgi:hypothetical protein
MRAAAAALLSLLAAAPAAAQVQLTGRLERPTVLDAARLAAEPQVDLDLRTASERGPIRARFEGPLLWPLLLAAGPVDADGPRSRLQHVVMVRGRDGYAVALSFGELDPAFAGTRAILAMRRDGAALPAPMLVVPGDARAGRNVRDVTVVELR